MKRFLTSYRSQLTQLKIQSGLKLFSPFALAALTLFFPESIAPIASASGVNIPNAIASLQDSQQRWLEVDLSNQRLIAWQGNTQVYAVIISGGTEFDPTLPGTFTIQSKHESARMQGQGYDGETYDIPDVPFTMYYDGNYAIHGAYWHESFGTPVSRGCINVAVNHAEWFFSWTSIGTPVVVHY